MVETDDIFEFPCGPGECLLIRVEGPKGRGLQLDRTSHVPDVQHDYSGCFGVLIADPGGPPHTGRPVQSCATQDAAAKVFRDAIQTGSKTVGSGQL